MKKMLLILVSGLLLLCMAGSAMAFPYDAAIWNADGTKEAPAPIPLKPGDSVTLSYRGTNIGSTAFGTSLKYVITVDPVDPTDSKDDVIITQHKQFFTPTQKDYTDVGVVTITLKSTARQSASYTLAISAGERGSDVEFGGASRNISSIPEFPTVAAPVAAILGLFFIIGRKKEGL